MVPHVYNQHPVVYAQHGVYGYAGYPTHYAAGYPGNMVARNIWPLSLSNVKDSKAKFETSTSTCGGTQGAAGTSACTLSGEIIFSQNGLKDVLCGNNGGLTINLQGSGMVAGNKYKIFLDTATDLACTLATTTTTEIVEITAPVVGVNNGVNIYMCTDGFNVDGANGKTTVVIFHISYWKSFSYICSLNIKFKNFQDGKYIGIMDTTSTAKTVNNLIYTKIIFQLSKFELIYIQTNVIFKT